MVARLLKHLNSLLVNKYHLKAYLPIKDGYIFDGRYFDPRTKVERVTEIILNENIIVYTKWIDDASQKPQIIVAQALANGNYRDTKTGVPITALWVQQNTRLQELMAIYNEKFNK